MTRLEFVKELLPLLLSVLSAVAGLLIAIIRTRQTAITNKVEKSIDITTANSKKINLTNYYILVDGKKIKLDEITIYKEE